MDPINPLAELTTINGTEYMIHWGGHTGRVEFTVWEVIAWEEDPTRTPSYMVGVIKSDGCSQVNFEQDMHLCGRGCWQAHVDIVRHVWRRAFELMDSPYPAEDCAPLR